MSVSDPSNPSFINCTVIQLYTQSSFLKVTMTTQGLAGLISMLSMSLTLKKIFTTVTVDRAFKEYLLASYAVQFMQACALFLLQILLLTTHIVSAPCEAYVPAKLCYLLRITTTTISTLPFLNVALTIFRFLVLRNNNNHRSSWKECIWLFRGFQVIAMAIGIAFQVYKYSGVYMDGYVVYCIGNFPGMNDKMVHESIGMSCCEAFAIIFSSYLFRSYKKSDRSFEVNCSLLRRQAIQTFHLFISYSLIQAATFWGFSWLSTLYRTTFSYLREPQYSAGSGFFFIPMYYTMFSPWLIYYILRREEMKRIQTTNELLARENNGTVEYFAMMKTQWGEPQCSTKNDQTTNFERLIKFFRLKRSAIRPVNSCKSDTFC